jgi:hypothetical protein
MRNFDYYSWDASSMDNKVSRRLDFWGELATLLNKDRQAIMRHAENKLIGGQIYMNICMNIFTYIYISVLPYVYKSMLMFAYSYE